LILQQEQQQNLPVISERNQGKKETNYWIFSNFLLFEEKVATIDDQHHANRYQVRLFFSEFCI
jgi:hypothetical protein